MSFVAPNTPTVATEQDQSITNHEFFPNLSLLEFRSGMRVDSVTTKERAVHALYRAMLEVNGRLWAWADQKKAQGISTLDDVTQKKGHPAGAIKKLYLTAVWSLAKAELVERIPDYDTTNAGKDKADSLEPAAETYRRDASWAINDIIGAPRSTIELI